jgi:signal transduction histidine kinase
VAFTFGIARAGWETHSALEPLHTVLQALAFTALLRVDWEGWIGRGLRNPVGAGALTGILGGALHIADLHASSLGTPFDAAIFALSWLPAALGAGILEGSLSAAAAFMLASALRLPWSHPQALRPSPHGFGRLGRISALLGLGTVVMMAGFTWLEMVGIREAIGDERTLRMEPLAERTAQELQAFLQTGRVLITHLGDDVGLVISSNPSRLGDVAMSMVPLFFEGLSIVDGKGEVLFDEPSGWLSRTTVQREIDQRWALALEGIPSELTLHPGTVGQGASVVFFAPIDLVGQTSAVGALAGKTAPGTPGVAVLRANQASSREVEDVFVGTLEGEVLWPAYAPTHSALQNASEWNPELGIRIASDGTLQLAHFEELDGYAWRVLVTVPLEAAVGGRVASMARGLLAVLAAACVALTLVWDSARRRSIDLRRVATELATLAGESHPRPEPFDDAAGLLPLVHRLEAALEGRRRVIDVGTEIDRRIASGRELREILPEALEILRSTVRADLARIVLHPELAYLLGLSPSFQAGSDPGEWRRLDGQILALCSESGHLVLENPARAKPVLDTVGLLEPIQALLAQSLKSGGNSQGVIWFGYLAPRNIPPSEVAHIGGFLERIGDAVAKTYRYRRAESERLRALLILDSIPDPIVLTNHAGDLVFANPPAEDLLKEVRLRPEREKGPIGGARQAPKRQGTPFVLSATEEIRSGEGRVFRPQILEVGSRIERREYRIYVLRDLSEQDFEDRLRSSIAAATGEDARKTLEQLLAYGRMLSAVGTMSDQQEELIRKSQDSGLVLDHLLEDLLLIGATPIRSLPMRESIELGPLLDEIVAAHSPLARNRQVRLVTDQPVPSPSVEGNRLMIRQAISTLARSALLATPGGGSVSLTARLAGEEVRITVADTGRGIAPADLERILGKAAPDRAEEREEGEIGAGIRMARDVAARHGGTLTAESRLGAGTKIALLLPVRRT